MLWGVVGRERGRERGSHDDISTESKEGEVWKGRKLGLERPLNTPTAEDIRRRKGEEVDFFRPSFQRGLKITLEGEEGESQGRGE